MRTAIHDKQLDPQRRRRRFPLKVPFSCRLLITWARNLGRPIGAIAIVVGLVACGHGTDPRSAHRVASTTTTLPEMISVRQFCSTDVSHWLANQESADALRAIHRHALYVDDTEIRANLYLVNARVRRSDPALFTSFMTKVIYRCRQLGGFTQTSTTSSAVGDPQCGSTGFVVQNGTCVDPTDEPNHQGTTANTQPDPNQCADPQCSSSDAYTTWCHQPGNLVEDPNCAYR